MLSSLDIRNFQSLKDVHIDLGLLTVIVGESNSGKSALVRSIQALASNLRGTSSITMGFKSASISASSDDFTVTLEKSESSSSYKIAQVKQEDREFTKLAGDTPDEITALLGLDPVREDQSINFAGQHDSPFLLTASGASVARTLGELTNVNTVFKAVREANRLRTGANSDLKLRKKDLEEAEAQLGQFEGLENRIKALKLVENHVKEIKKLENDIISIENALQSIEELSSRSEIPAEVDVTAVETAFEEFKDLYVKAERLSALEKHRKEHADRLTKLTKDQKEAEEQMQHVLKEMGKCPLCQQPTT